ncbi:MAG: Fic family protein [Chitinophagales bacterium]
MNPIQKAILLKAELDTLRPLKKDDELRIMQKFRLDWNYHSNSLEGNSLSYGETKALILFGLTASGKPLKDHFEMTGHNEAVKWISEIVKQERPLTESFIRELHTLILKDSYFSDAITADGQKTRKKINVGVYKTAPNHVLTKIGEIFRFATPEETPAKMNDLINWYRGKADEKDINAIVLAAQFHYKYIRIHPFDDGNGRTARLLMNFILMRFGFPPVIVKQEDKQHYFEVLQLADAGNLNAFVDYIAENLIHSLELMIKGAKGESIEEADDLDKELAVLDMKIKEVSEEMIVLKQEIDIENFARNLVLPLAEKFIQKNVKMAKFYSKSHFYCRLNEEEDFNWQDNRLNLIRAFDKLINTTVSLLDNFSLVFDFFSFKKRRFPEFDFIARIDIFFMKAKYEIVNEEGTIFLEKQYHEKLTKKEINDIVAVEIRRHIAFLEEKMKEIED